MTHLLVIRSSANGERSITNQLVDSYLAAVTAHDPGAQVAQRDLDRDPVPHVTSETLAGIGRPAPETASSQSSRELSDTLIAELVGADTLIIGLPMYNFGMPSTLKSWFDHVLRAGVTFQYTANGPEGLVTNTRAVILAARAGAYADAGPDFQLGHVRTLLNFMGITDIEVVLAEGLAFGEAAAGAAIAAAHEAIDKLVKVPA
jgi:FMN-dependent NADH-azoreductase